MFFALTQNAHTFYPGHHPQPGSPPARGPQGGEGGPYPNGNLVPYLNQHSGDAGDMAAGAPQLDAFYIQQPPGSFAVPLDVPDVNAYGHPQGALPPAGIPMRGPPNMPNWGAPSRQSPASGGPHDGPHDEADMLHGAHGYPHALSDAQARNMAQPMYGRANEAHRQMLMEQEAAARGARGAPLPKRRRTSPMPFGESNADLLSRFRGAPQGVRGGPGAPPNARMGRRDVDGAHDPSGLSELLPGAEEGGAPSGDLASWILGPDEQQRNAHFAMPDAAAYYRQNSMGQPQGIRLDMPGLAQGHQAMDPSKGLTPLRSHAPNSDDEPLYVNAKQYQRILKRRVARARMEEKRRQMWLIALKQREGQKNGGNADLSEEWVSGLLALDEEAKKPYLHESRHKHAMRRPRGPGGRFLTTEEIRKRDDEEAARKAQEEATAPSADAPTDES